MEIQEYLDKYSIVKIGKHALDEVCSDTIVETPMRFIDIIEKNGCYISSILWWDYAEISSGSCIGYGGTRDPRNPDCYFYAETDIYREFESGVHSSVYYKYIRDTKKKYPQCRLVPSFTVKRTSKKV